MFQNGRAEILYTPRLIYSNVFSASFSVDRGQVAQLVEHRTENAGVAGSIPALATNLRSRLPRSVSYGWQARRRLSTVAAKQRRAGRLSRCEYLRAAAKVDRRALTPALLSRSFHVFRVLPLLLVLVDCRLLKEAPRTRPPRRSRRPEQAPPGARRARSPSSRFLRSSPTCWLASTARTVTRSEFEEFVQNLEGRAGGPVPADQRDHVYRGVLDQIVGYKLLLQEVEGAQGRRAGRRGGCPHRSDEEAVPI